MSENVTLPVLLSKGEIDEEKIEKPFIPSIEMIALAKRNLALNRVLKNGAVLLFVLWFNTVWLYGGFYNSYERTSNLNVLVADFDGSSVGAALLSAVGTLNGLPTSTTFTILPANTTSPSDILDRLYRGECWGIIYSSPNSTKLFENALLSSDAALNYNPANAIIYSGLEVRYSSSFSSYVLPSLLQVSSIATSIFTTSVVSPILSKSLNQIPQVSILLNPIGSTFVNFTPFTFGSRIMFNTLGSVLPILMQFFFLLSMNGCFTMLGQYNKTTLTRLLIVRIPIQTIWAGVTSLSFSGWCLIFQETYNIGSAGNFFALWAVNFVHSFITFDALDAILAYTPLPFQASTVVTWILLSVASTSLPIELQSAFYKIHYAFPAHATFQTMIVIFGKGATFSTLNYNLPILAIWLIFAKIIATMGLNKRCREGNSSVVASPGH